MNKIVILGLKILIIILALSALIFFLLVTKANGHLDPYYIRFTTPPAKSLIIGTSRAAQGMHPTIIKDELSDLGYELPLLNYSFTLIHSSYGEVYLNCIKEKLDPKTKNGIFILTVDPWCISTISIEDDHKMFLERETFMAELTEFNSKPNFEYLLDHYDNPYYMVFKKRAIFLHDDGWLEVNIPMDSASVKKRISAKILNYKKNSINYSFSNNRFKKLKETIRFLKKHGEVWLVRLPVSPEIKMIEEDYMPDFDQKAGELTKQYNLNYINMIQESGKYQTTDGNHLHKESGKIVTENICKIIQESKHK